MKKCFFAYMTRIDLKWVVALGLSLFALYRRFLWFQERELWGDELYQFQSMKGPFQPFWLHCNFGDHTSFPGEYLLNYPLIQIFGLNKWGLSILHIFITIAGLYFLYRLCRRYLKLIGGYIVAFLMFGLNETLTWHAFEFRPYAVLPTLALGSLYFAHLIVEEHSTLGGIRKFFIGLFFVVTVSYHAYGILIFLLPVIYVIMLDIFRRGSQSVIREGFMRYLFIVAVIAIPIWSWYASSNFFGLNSNIMQSRQYTFEFIPNPAVNFLGFLKGIVGNLVGYKPLYFLLGGVGAALLLPYKFKSHLLIFILWLVVLPIELILFTDLRSQYWFLQRQFIWIMPFFALFVGWCWDTLLLKITRREAR